LDKPASVFAWYAPGHTATRRLPGDGYRLTYRQAETPITADLLVESNYTINMKVFGSLYAAGMTFAQVKPLIEKAVTNAYPRSMPSVTIYSLEIFQVFPRGETLSDAVRAVRGSIAPLADLSSASVLRQGSADPIFVDLRELLSKSVSSSDMPLQANDRVVIPLLSFSVFVSGAVEKPGTYPFAPGRTYHYYVILAGGSTQDAPGKIFITDVNGKMRDQKEVIQSEDRIFVIPATVMVQGAVFAPGSFPFRDGLPVSYYVNLASGIDPERNFKPFSPRKGGRDHIGAPRLRPRGSCDARQRRADSQV
jgi:protein involved in polysaccharide export with SLBB domain